MLKLTKLSIFVFLFALVFTFTTSVMAMEDVETTSEDVSVTTTNSNKSDRAIQAQEKKEAMMEAKEERKNALSEARLKICEARQDRIQNRLTNLMNLGTSSHDAFDTMVVRVEAFYDERLADSDTGTEITTLRAQIDTNKEAVVPALAGLKENGGEFDCESDDPKGQVDAFRTSARELIDANKNYKKSVRAYVAAVRELAKEVKAAKNVSITPAESPDVTSSGESEAE